VLDVDPRDAQPRTDLKRRSREHTRTGDNPPLYGEAAVLFTVVATLACLLPSLRASRIDPLLALRSD